MTGVRNVFKKYDPYPVIVDFQNGNLREGEYEIEGGMYTNSKSRKRSALLALDNMLYIGDEMKADNSFNIIVTRNKNTGEVRLIEVGRALVKAYSELEQQLSAEMVKTTNGADDTDAVDTWYEIGEAFGSKRRKRILDQSKKLKVDIDTMKDQLEKTVSEKQIDIKEVSQVNTEGGVDPLDYAPPCNRDADKVEDVYKLSDLISNDQIEALKETANNVLETENFEEFIEITPYIKNYIVRLKSTTTDKKVETCCILLYTDCIIRYLKDPYSKIRSFKYVVCSYSESINKSVLERFSLPCDKGRTRPPQLKDKAICHSILLLLLCNNFSIIDTVELSKSISTPLPRLSQLCKVFGAHYNADSKKLTSITLKLPLAQPPAPKRRRLTK